jgi:diguanylate cyclase (GGDEF)-like protein
MGGDEFEIGLEGAGLPEAFQFAEEVRTSLRRSLEAWGEEHCPQFTVSIGIACYPEDGEAIADLARRADRAMYAAKAAGSDATHAWRQLPSRRAA